ncbi:FKBP-type peptidyl-prolyl cis-trans isomerase [Leucothrix arctica]|nr:FKBP-type peptidyl-prolyl cis-trans isomerase [Leucothrix arctica]
MGLKGLRSTTALISVAVLLTACGGNGSNDTKSMEAAALAATQADVSFQKIDTVVGTGATATAGQTVTVHYTGWLYDTSAPENKGKKFDSSVDRGQPFVFPLGAGKVIKGWENGFSGMKVGGKRTLIIPSEMGYGSRGAGSSIPGNATLLFDVEMLGVK